MNSSTESPGTVANLSKADPEKLNELMSKDARELTKEEMIEIVAHFRAGYKSWAAEESKSKSQGRRAKTSKGQKEKSEGALDLSQIKIDLGDL